MNIKNHVISTKNEYITSPYGKRVRNGRVEFHYGVDFVDAKRLQLTSDVHILAFEDGKVVIASYGASVGNFVDILHNGKILTRYMHMKPNSVKVKTGDIVKKGQPLGVMGTTGDSTGIHLHFSVKENSTSYLNGSYVDPMLYLEGKKTISATISQPQPNVQNIAQKFKKDDKVLVKPGSKWWNKVGIANWIFGKEMYTVTEQYSDETICISTAKGGAITGRIKVTNLLKI